ncbi:MAG: ASCH domain-containing protein [Clostridia bacterium]|nr:ASCH domain-containing protein [Clostridia bacterium]
MTAAELWERSGLTGRYEAWAFGGAPDKLAELTAKGLKTATSSALSLFRASQEPLPQAGDYSVILDSKGNAVCIIRTTNVYVTRFDQVPEVHAIMEGEGDLSLDYWRSVHEEFFTEELRSIGLRFGPDMDVVCEAFELAYVE